MTLTVLDPGQYDLSPGFTFTYVDGQTAPPYVGGSNCGVYWFWFLPGQVQSC